jgi:NlpC/P60 family putative phage cell wall peptidase
MEIELSRGDAEPRSDLALPPRSGGSTAEGGEGGGCCRPLHHSLCSWSPSAASQGRNLSDSAPPRFRAPSFETAERIVAIARFWIGTPYVHQASLKGVGCDCLGLLRGIWRELYGEEPEEIPPYSLDWAEATGAETLYMALKRHAHEIGAGSIAPGDIALFRMGGRGPAKHCGVIGIRQRAFGSRDPYSHDCRLPVADCRLTLIHARQNKRVSEEPLSALWNRKLAFAFRI